MKVWLLGTLRCHGKRSWGLNMGVFKETPQLIPFLHMPSEAFASFSATQECPEIREITWIDRKVKLWMKIGNSHWDFRSSCLLFHIQMHLLYSGCLTGPCPHRIFLYGINLLSDFLPNEVCSFHSLAKIISSL